MAKGTSLRDEIRQERLKGLEGKSFSYKLKYYVYYYKFHVLTAVILLLLAGAFIKSVLNQKENALSLALINANQAVDYEEWITEYSKLMGITDKQEMSIDYSYTFSNELYGYQTEQKFFVATAAGNIDAIIAPKTYFDKYAMVGYMVDLSKLLDESYLEENKELLHEVTLDEESGGVTEVAGVDVSDAIKIKEEEWYSNIEEPLYFGIVVESKNMEEAFKLLKYLQK